MSILALFLTCFLLHEKNNLLCFRTLKVYLNIGKPVSECFALGLVRNVILCAIHEIHALITYFTPGTVALELNMT